MLTHTLEEIKVFKTKNYMTLDTLESSRASNLIDGVLDPKQNRGIASPKSDLHHKNIESTLTG